MKKAVAPADVTIIGGGLAGLYAAIVAAEAGARVVIYEAARALGGRARSTDGDFKANYGPHALYGDGPVVPWLRSHGLLPHVRQPPRGGFRLRLDGILQQAPDALLDAVSKLTTAAPENTSFGEWAVRRTSPAVADVAASFASLPTFHAHPEQLSAAFVAERFRRLTRTPTSVRYVDGGWTTLVEGLGARASELGVSVQLSSHISKLPEPPVIVATSARSAAKLLGQHLPHAGTSVALLDVGVNDTRPQAPFAVLDLDERTYVARYSAIDAGLAPHGAHLIQASAPLRSGETHDEATARLERAIEEMCPGWSTDCRWRRQALATDSTGAVDLPGHSWRDRPSITQPDGAFLAGDYVAAPGLLSEVSWACALTAAKLAIAWQPPREAGMRGTVGQPGLSRSS